MGDFDQKVILTNRFYLKLNIVLTFLIISYHSSYRKKKKKKKKKKKEEQVAQT